MSKSYTARELFEDYTGRLQTLYPEQEASNIVQRLLEDLAGWSRVKLALNGNEEVDQETLERLTPQIRRLEEGEPVQYVVGEVEFLGCRIKVNSSVLIPRPETELLADHILKQHALSNKRMLDIGTGSGCLALALKKHCPDATVEAVDISEEALKVAEQNAELNQLEVNFRQLDVLKKAEQLTLYDLIVCNPPYVPNHEKEGLHPNVRDYEPEEALFVDDQDPLLFFRHVAELSENHLAEGGWLYFEVHSSLAGEVKGLLKQYALEGVEVINDWQKHPRIVKARKSGNS